MKDILRMQMMAGIITESEYKNLLEDMSVINKILDKISSQGEKSLTPEEKNYLDQYSKGEKNLIDPYLFQADLKMKMIQEMLILNII